VGAGGVVLGSWAACVMLGLGDACWLVWGCGELLGVLDVYEGCLGCWMCTTGCSRGARRVLDGCSTGATTGCLGCLGCFDRLLRCFDRLLRCFDGLLAASSGYLLSAPRSLSLADSCDREPFLTGLRRSRLHLNTLDSQVVVTGSSQIR
jgi:hypothetical protein